MTEIERKGALLRTAAPSLALASTETKNAALCRIADALEQNTDSIIAANQTDVQNAKAAGMNESLVDRLLLNEARVRDMAKGVRELVALPDPIGEQIEQVTRPNGMTITKVRVPIGVIAMIYEARPNVTVDAAAIALKTGNAILLRGSGSALASNRELTRVIKSALAESALPETAVELIEDASHDSVAELLHARGLIDLLIPRGGAGLIGFVTQNATVPVIETGVGNCHIYVEATAKPEMAEQIVLNAKTQRPSVCNAAETLLIDKAYPYMPQLLDALRNAGVKLFGCTRICAQFDGIAPAGEKDWAEEYLDLCMAVKIVDGIDEAMAHIARYGTRHTETVITENAALAERFLRAVDSAVVNHNVSSRMTDGGMFGFGAEIGISTQKIHARGPMGLRELTSYKYYVTGDGQIR